MLTWAPRVPSRKSRFAKTGSPSRESPIGTLRSMPSKKSASSRRRPVGAPHRLARPRRHEDLGLDARDLHVGGLGDGRRQHARLDEEHVGVEPRALVARAHEVDDAEEADLAAVGQGGRDLDRRRRAGGTGPRPPPPRTRAASRPACRGRVRPVRMRSRRHLAVETGLDGTPKEQGVAEEVLEAGLEPADRVQVLGSTRVARLSRTRTAGSRAPRGRRAGRPRRARARRASRAARRR